MTRGRVRDRLLGQIKVPAGRRAERIERESYRLHPIIRSAELGKKRLFGLFLYTDVISSLAWPIDKAIES